MVAMMPFLVTCVHCCLFFPSSLYGGVPKWEQKDTIKKGVSVVVATPGRLRDLLEEGSIDLSEVQQRLHFAVVLNLRSAPQRDLAHTPTSFFFSF